MNINRNQLGEMEHVWYSLWKIKLSKFRKFQNFKPSIIASKTSMVFIVKVKMPEK